MLILHQTKADLHSRTRVGPAWLPQRKGKQRQLLNLPLPIHSYLAQMNFSILRRKLYRCLPAAQTTTFPYLILWRSPRESHSVCSVTTSLGERICSPRSTFRWILLETLLWQSRVVIGRTCHVSILLLFLRVGPQHARTLTRVHSVDHNSTHASDVLHCTNYFVHSNHNISKFAGDLDLLSIYLAAIIHGIANVMLEMGTNAQTNVLHRL